MSSTYQVIQTDKIRLNANESPFPVSKECLKEIHEAIDTVAFHRYPDDTHQQLKEAYAKYLQVNSDQLIMGNGSDEMIGLLIATQIKKGDCVYTMDPDFSMYDYYTGMHEGIMAKYPYPLDTPFHVDDFINRGKSVNAKTVIFSNPNNPSGQCIAQNDIIKIIEAFSDGFVVIDEAYGEFSETSMIPYLDQYHNLIVLRTMSKAFGMAAVRCGCMVSCADTISKLIPCKVPYNINSLTQRCAVILLSHYKEIQKNIQAVIAERERMSAEIQRMNLCDVTLYPSKANYIYGTSVKKQAFLDALQQQHITIRDYAGKDSFRITIGTPQENDMILHTLKSVFSDIDD